MQVKRTNKYLFQTNSSLRCIHHFANSTPKIIKMKKLKKKNLEVTEKKSIQIQFKYNKIIVSETNVSR